MRRTRLDTWMCIVSLFELKTAADYRHIVNVYRLLVICVAHDEGYIQARNATFHSNALYECFVHTQLQCIRALSTLNSVASFRFRTQTGINGRIEFES